MFKFRLESVLKYRKIKEEEVLREYQEKKSEILSIENHIIEIKKEISNSKNNYKVKNIKAQDLRVFNSYIVGLEKKLETNHDKLKDLQKELAIIEKKLMEARKERKIIENLKEKQLQEYLKIESKKEQTFLDEVGVMKYNRKKKDS